MSQTAEDCGEMTAVIKGNAAPNEKLAADDQAACNALATRMSEMPSSSLTFSVGVFNSRLRTNGHILSSCHGSCARNEAGKAG